MEQPVERPVPRLEPVRPARPDDVPAITRLVRDLAAYEREPDAAVATDEDFATALFGPDPKVFAHVAVELSDDGSEQVVGVAVWYLTFSTWLGRHGIWLEDLFVQPDHRGRGHGVALLRELARVAVERGYGRVEWWVLDWNAPSIEFYRSLGARAEDEWTVYRLDGAALARLGGGDRPSVAHAPR